MCEVIVVASGKGGTGKTTVCAGLAVALAKNNKKVLIMDCDSGMRGVDIHLYARMISLADLYDNITTEREGCRKETPFAAIDRITVEMYTKLDPMVCVPFLTHIKEAFMGSRVLLSTGLSGTVVRYNQDFTSRPLLRVLNNQLLDLNEFPDVQIIDYNPKN